MGLSDQYCDAVYREQRMYAAWWPHSKVRLGDYGTLEGRRFVRLGNIVDPPLSIQPALIPEPLGNRYRVELATRDTSVFKFGAGFEVTSGYVSVKPGLKVDFTDDFGLYVNLGGVSVQKMMNLADVATAVCRAATLKDSDPKKWHDRRFVLVTEVCEAKNAVVLLSQRKGTQIVLEAKADVPNIDLANVNLSFELKKDSTSTAQFFPQEPGKPLAITPLFSLAYVDRGVFGLGGGNLKPKTLSGATAKAPTLVSLNDGDLAELGPPEGDG